MEKSLFGGTVDNSQTFKCELEMSTGTYKINAQMKIFYLEGSTYWEALYMCFINVQREGQEGMRQEGTTL